MMEYPYSPELHPPAKTANIDVTRPGAKIALNDETYHMIDGAGLDVFEEQPLSPESPLREMPTVCITPQGDRAVYFCYEGSGSLDLRRFGWD